MPDPASFRIETARLLLVVPPLDSVDRMVAYCVRNRDHLSRWESPRPRGYYKREYWARRLREIHEECESGASLRLVLLDRRDPAQEIVGTCNLTQFVRGPSQSCMVGYGLDRQREGQGLMSEALRAVLGYAFEVLKVKRVSANYMPVNERSGALLQKLGFTVEGYAREYVFINGAWRDHLLTSLLNPNPSHVTSVAVADEREEEP